MATKSKVTVKVALMNMIREMRKKFDANAKLVFHEKTYKREEILAVLQAHLDAIGAVETAEAQLAVLRLKRGRAATSAREIGRRLELFLRATYGADNATLLDFGLAPAKGRKVTIETKADAVEKARRTREARGTLGKKERLKIKGKVEAPAEAPATPDANVTKRPKGK